MILISSYSNPISSDTIKSLINSSNFPSNQIQHLVSPPSTPSSTSKSYYTHCNRYSNSVASPHKLSLNFPNQTNTSIFSTSSTFNPIIIIAQKSQSLSITLPFFNILHNQLLMEQRKINIVQFQHTQRIFTFPTLYQSFTLPDNSPLLFLFSSNSFGPYIVRT